MKLETRWAKKTAPPFVAMPYFAAGLLGQRGGGRIQPVFVEDVARGFVDCLEKPDTIGHSYPLGGPEPMTWPQMHEIIAQIVVGHRRWTLPLPAPVAKFYAAIGIGKLLGFNRDQIEMSQQENTCDMKVFEQDFGWKTRGLAETVREYLRADNPAKMS